MRWIFYFLLITNAAYFTYSLYTRSNLSTQEKGKTKVVLGLDGAQKPSASKKKPVKTVEEELEELDGPLCYELGPATDKELSAIVSFFENKGIDYTAEMSVEKAVASYVVHLIGMNSREEAEERVADLKVFDIQSYVISLGPHKNTVAVGSYSVAANAKARQQEVENLGFNEVNITPKMAETTQKRLNVTLSEALIVKEFRQLMANNKNTVDFKEKTCI